MRPLILFIRKYRQGWTDAESIILLMLAEDHLLTLTELSEKTGTPVSSVHHAIQSLLTRGMIQARTVERKKFYRLTKEGETAIFVLLSNFPKSLLETADPAAS